jgi:hypothetical protein
MFLPVSEGLTVPSTLSRCFSSLTSGDVRMTVRSQFRLGMLTTPDWGGENKVVDLEPSNKMLAMPARSFSSFLAANKDKLDRVFA